MQVRATDPRFYKRTSARDEYLRKLVAIQEEAEAIESIQNTPPWVKRARAHPLNFMRSVLLDPRGYPIKTNAVQEVAVRHILDAHERGYHAGVLAPWGHGKTTAGIGLALDWIGRDPTIRLQFVSRVDEVAFARGDSVKQYIESDRYRMVYPAVRRHPDQWGKRAFRVERVGAAPDPTVRGLGINATSVGSRSDRTIFEDPIDISALSPKERARAHDSFWNTHVSRIEQPDGLAVYLGTLYHDDDLASELLESPGWSWVVIGVHSGFGKLEWVRYFNEEEDYDEAKEAA